MLRNIEEGKQQDDRIFFIRLNDANLFWILLIDDVVAFVKYMPLLLQFVRSVVCCVRNTVLCFAVLAPKIISVLNRLSTTLLFKFEKSIILNNAIETVQVLLRDAKDTLKGEKNSNIYAGKAIYN